MDDSNNMYKLNNVDLEYQKLLKDILKHGNKKEDRTGTGTLSVFGRQLRFNLQEGFPLLTTKKINFKNIAVELLWFLSGSTDIKYLLDNNVNIWNRDAYRHYKKSVLYKLLDLSYEDFIDYARKNGFILDEIYGKQWTDWQPAYMEYDRYLDDGSDMLTEDTINQVQNVIDNIKKDPDSRRHLVSAWNPGELDVVALPPCHVMFQFYVANGKLFCHMYQRSADSLLGLPYNIASYALLTHIVAKMTDLDVGELTISTGDTHLYLNHRDQAIEQLSRTPTELPKLEIKNKYDNIQDYSLEDFELTGYNPRPAIKADLSVGE